MVLQGLESRMDRGNWKIITVDEVEVPHRKVGANRFAGKIERSAGASQDCHILIHCPFKKQYVKAERVTGRQIALHVAKCSDHLPTNFSSKVVTAFALTIEGAFPLSVDKRYWLGTSAGM